MTLGSNLAQVLLEHPKAQRSAKDSARLWAWSGRGGGTVAVTTDDTGKITRVEFVADKGQENNVDLPCVGNFPVQDSHVNLEFALNKTACSAFSGLTYGLPDRSMVEVRFNGPGDGQLTDAIWYRPSERNPSPVGHWDPVIHYLRPALTFVGGAARIYYAGECRAAEKDTSGSLQFLFPPIFLQPAPAGVTGMDAVRQIFRDDPNVTVAQDRSGMVRITIGSVSTAVLQTRIQVLALDPGEQYTPPAAIAIENTPEIRAAEPSLNLGGGMAVIDIIESGPVEPHLPMIMRNIIVDEALDAVARTFKGIVTYGICKQPDGKSRFYLNYIYGS